MTTRVQVPRATARSVGVDVIKGLAILGVILQHVVISDAKRVIGGPLWFEQAVPVFVLLFAFNAAGGFRRGGRTTLRALYSASFWRSRFRRLVLPLVPVWVVLIVVGGAQGRLDVGPLQLIGAAPLDQGAPGDYFVLLVIALAILLPFAWWAFLRRPRTTVAALFALAIANELVARTVFLPAGGSGQFLAVANPLRFAATVAVGFCIAAAPDGWGALQRHRGPVTAAALVSLAYLVAVIVAPDGAGRDGFGVFFPGFIVATAVWALGWTTVLTAAIVTGVDRVAAAGRAGKLAPLATLGEASYHVFLVQMAVIGLWRTREPAWLVVEVVVSLLVGWAFWRLTEGRRRRPAAAPAR